MLKFLILFLFITNTLYSNGKISFLISKADVIEAGENSRVRVGMQLSNNAEIHSYQGSRVIIYSSKTKSTYVLSGKAVFKMNNIKKNSSQKLLRQFRSTKKRISSLQTIAAVRGSEMGEADISWDTGEEEKPKETRDKEWKLFEKKNFSEVIRKTKRATDAEGIFLSSMSKYYSTKGKDKENVIKSLKSVIQKSRSLGLREEARKNIATIYFENGNFVKAKKTLSKLEKNLAWKNWDEKSFYLIIMVHYYSGQDKKAKKYTKIMKKYFPKSKLLQHIPQL